MVSATFFFKVSLFSTSLRLIFSSSSSTGCLVFLVGLLEGALSRIWESRVIRGLFGGGEGSASASRLCVRDSGSKVERRVRRFIAGLDSLLSCWQKVLVSVSDSADARLGGRLTAGSDI